ncbi:hypothetical protein J7E62_02675 [Variovorax paradoxus]|nr:hypothetical protein [Variovorax paradoxus]
MEHENARGLDLGQILGQTGGFHRFRQDATTRLSSEDIRYTPVDSSQTEFETLFPLQF